MISGGQTYGENENLTLTDADLRAVGEPKPNAGGRKLRAYCPIHGSDHQRSLEVDMDTGRFGCHACGCWGYLDWAREEFRRERGLERETAPRSRPASSQRPPVRRPPPPPPVEPVRDDLPGLMERFREALPGSWGERYLEYRGIPVEVALEYGVGYALPGEWPGRGWKGGRLVFPHTDPDGRIVNLYGRAVAKGEVPKKLKHDHLRGNKGYWNTAALREGSGPLYVCEAALDALALIACGIPDGRAVAIFGTHGWRWEWLPEDVRRIVVATDADDGGQKTRREVGDGARLRGIEVAYLDTENYGGLNDPAAAYAAGTLAVGEWPESGERLLEEPSEKEAWDPEWAAGLFPATLREVSRLVGGAGLAGEVDTSAADAAIDEMQDAYELEDTEGLRGAAERAWKEAQRVGAAAEGTGGGG